MGSLNAAYDYRAFGEQVNLTVPADKVTETFTGKELDDETDLGYWGARYLDQMLGLWVSADPKRQFASPYLYAGNGSSSINAVDPDGQNIVRLVIVAGVAVYEVISCSEDAQRAYSAARPVLQATSDSPISKEIQNNYN